MTDRITALLRPRSVAVIGASSDPLKRGHQAIRRLQEDGFPHPIYPVNPRADEILGLRCYPDVEAIPHEVDLALVVTPAAVIPDLLHACGRKGVAAAVVIAVGFGETGADGRALEDEVAAAAAEHGIALVGPNTNGVLDLPSRLNLVGASDVPEGELALVCQSGNMGLSLFTDAVAMGAVGYSSYIGIGNEAGVRYHELLPHLAEDPHTGAVVLYAEGFRDGRAFLEAAAALTRRKPVVIYKAGRSEAARRSALSHTGAVAGRPEVADALLRQAGIEVVGRSDELLPVAEALLHQPPLAAPRIAVLADGGGHATVAADALAREGLELAELSDRTRARLAGVLPAAASTVNPVDVAGGTDRDPSLFSTCVELLLDDEQVAGVLCVGLLGGYGLRFSADLAGAEEQAATDMARGAAEARKALVVQSAYASRRPRAHQLLRDAGVGVHASVEIAVRCLGALARRGGFLRTADQRSTFPSSDGPARIQLEQPVPTGRRVLTEPDGRALLEKHGLDLGPWELVTDADQAARAASAAGRPVAMKIVSPEVVHKSDVGGVALDVDGAEEARAVYVALLERVHASLPEARLEGVLVSPMARDGLELLVGATTDATFGPMLTVGAGGTTVELLEDATFRAIPVTPTECDEMLDGLTISPLLDGFRGADAVDRTALIDLLLGVSATVQADPDIVELDLNPVIAHRDGLSLVDVRVVTATTEPNGPSGRGISTRNGPGTNAPPPTTEQGRVNR